MFQLVSKYKLFVLALFLSLNLVQASEVSCLSKKFSIKITEEASLKEVINQLSDICSFSVIASDAFSKKTLSEQVSSINIKNMSLGRIFDILLSEKNLNYEFLNNVLKISALKTKTFKIDYITSVREGKAVTKASVDSAPVETGSSQGGGESDEKSIDNLITTTEKFDFWEKLDAELKAILNNTSEEIVAPDPIINQNAGLITITGMPSQLKRAEAYIKEMQKRLKKQVVIDVSIISVDLNNEYKKGIDWSKFNLGFKSFIDIPGITGEDGKVTFTKSNTGLTITRPSGHGSFKSGLNIAAGIDFNIDGILNFLETNGKAKIVSSPKVTTLNNQQALISVGDNINYRVLEETDNSNSSSGKTTVTYKQYSVFIGILLNLLPEVSDDNRIMLRINPSLSSFKYREDDVKNIGIREIAPDTLQKKLSTVVHVNSGDTIILGGLIGQTKGKDHKKVPLLGDIPFLGGAFKSTLDITKTTELVFVITPRVIDIEDKQSNKRTLKDLGFSKSLYE